MWCAGTGVAALLDDYGNVLSSGKPLGGGDGVPTFGGAAARQRSWQVLARSRNQSWASRWEASCERVHSSGTSSYSDDQHDLFDKDEL